MEPTRKTRFGALRFDFEQIGTFLDTYAQGFFDKDVLASSDGSSCGRDMELIRDSDDHGFHLRVSKHFLVSAIGHFWLPDLRHPVSQVIRARRKWRTAARFGLSGSSRNGRPERSSTSKDTNSNRVEGSFMHFQYLEYMLTT
mgnify:CR=1 FL=1